MDRRRLTGCMLVGWALFAVPMLCVGGEVSHACDHGSVETQCQHEESCPSDPCGGLVARVDRPRELEHGVAAVAVPAPFAGAVLMDESAASFVRCVESRPRANLPFPFSDVPLLI